MHKLAPDKAFQPKITVGKCADRDVWEWHLPDAKPEVRGVVEKTPLEETKTAYVVYLAARNHPVKPEDVEVPKMFPGGNGSLDAPLRENKIPKKVKTGVWQKRSKPIPEAAAHSVSGDSLPAESPVIDVPPVTVEVSEPVEPSVAVTVESQKAHKDVVAVESTLVGEASKVEAKPAVARTVPFYDGQHRNPYYHEILVATSVFFGDDDPKLNENANGFVKDDECNVLTELVPKMKDWNRAGLLADEIINEWTPCLGNIVLNEEERNKLWDIAQSRINTILTELREDCSQQVQLARTEERQRGR